MKKLIRFLLVLALGAVLGWVFNDVIDEKLSNKIGKESTDEVKNTIKEKTENGTKKAVVFGKAMIDAGKEAIDSSKIEE